MKCDFQMQHQYCEREKKEMVAKAGSIEVLETTDNMSRRTSKRFAWWSIVAAVF
jgi:hypothetical protein